MRIVGPRAEVEISSDANGHLLGITYKKLAYFVRFDDSEKNIAIDFARMFAGTSDLSPETVEYIWAKTV